MKIAAYILAGVLFVSLIMYLYISSLKKNITVDFDIKSIDLSKIALNQLSQKGAMIKTDVSVKINNSGDFGATFTCPKVNVYYKGVLIANTDNSECKTITIPKRSGTLTSHLLDTYVNATTLEAIRNVKLKIPTVFTYDMSVKFLGFLIKYKDTIIYK